MRHHRSDSVAFVLTAALALPARAAVTSGVTPDMDRSVRRGIDLIYSMDFDGAQAEFERLRTLSPDSPFGDFGLSSVGWARYVYGSELGDESLVKPFERQVAQTADKAKAWLAKHPDDAEVLLTLGAAEGILGRLQLTRREYLRAYFTARSSMKSVRAALAKDPRLFDAYLGLGMYDYYADLYPRVIRVLAKVVLGGDRARGIRQLELAAKQGRWMSTTAKMILVEIRTHDPFGARDPAAAVKLMGEVRAQYPKSAMLHSAQLIALYQAGRLGDFAAGSEEFVAKVADGRYRKADLAKGLVLLGTARWAQDDREGSLAAFRRAADLAPRNRWSVWALIRAGNVLDVLGRRPEAVLAYRSAAAEPDHWGYKTLAQQGIAQPFKAGGEFTVDPP